MFLGVPFSLYHRQGPGKGLEDDEEGKYSEPGEKESEVRGYPGGTERCAFHWIFVVSCSMDFP